MWYILKDKIVVEVSIEEYMEWCRDGLHSKFIVSKTYIGDVMVSTVFLGLDHSYDRSSEKPIVFETLIFGGKIDGYQWRYATWEEAEEGHSKACESVLHTFSLKKRALIKVISESIN